MNDHFVLGDRVVLVINAYNPRGECIPEGTVGTICGVARWLPQVDFGPQGVKAVAPHALQVLDVPDGAPLPDDGQPLGVWDLLVHTLKENHQLRVQVRQQQRRQLARMKARA
jgi:hypothetical protein